MKFTKFVMFISSNSQKGSSSPHDEFGLTIPLRNFQVNTDLDKYDASIYIHMEVQNVHTINSPFTITMNIIPMNVLSKVVSSSKKLMDSDIIMVTLVDDQQITLSKEIFVKYISLPLVKIDVPFQKLSLEEVFKMLYYIGYQIKLELMGDFKRVNLSTMWHFYCTTSIYAFTIRLEPSIELEEQCWNFYGGFSLEISLILELYNVNIFLSIFDE